MTGSFIYLLPFFYHLVQYFEKKKKKACNEHLGLGNIRAEKHPPAFHFVIKRMELGSVCSVNDGVPKACGGWCLTVVIK